LRLYKRNKLDYTSINCFLKMIDPVTIFLADLTFFSAIQEHLYIAILSMLQCELCLLAIYKDTLNVEKG
jgi:hypothetical protein